MTNFVLPPDLERDLHAYVDGMFDHDPVRRRSVEDCIARSAGAAAAVLAYREQNAALRNAYDGRIAEPVPDRLTAALALPPRSVSVARVAAVAAIAVAASTAGWIAGQYSVPERRQAADFAESVGRFYAGEPVTNAPGIVGPATANGMDQPMSLLPGRFSVSLQVPDLREHGYVLIGNEKVSIAGNDGVRLSYAEAGGTEEAFSLLLRPRWDEDFNGVRILRDRDISVAAWLDGPFAIAVTGRLRQENVGALAASVREAMHRPDAISPALMPEIPARHEAALSNGIGAEQLPENGPAPTVDGMPPGGDLISTN